MRALAASALLACGALIMGGCGRGEAVSESPAVTTGAAEIVGVRATESNVAELARHAASLYATRRAAGGGSGAAVEPRFQQAMAAAAGEVFGQSAFVEAARDVPPAPADVQAAQVAFATAMIEARAGRAKLPAGAADRVPEVDAARTLPTRYGVEVALLLQRMMAGYAAMEKGAPNAADARSLARDVVTTSRALASGGGDQREREEFRMLDRTSGAAYWSQQALAAMPPAQARRLIAWNASAEGRARNDALLAAWARANDEASERMLVDAWARAGAKAD